MASKRIYLIFLATVLALVAVFAWLSPTMRKPMVGESFDPFNPSLADLLPESQAQQVTFREADVPKELSESELRQIFSVIGRIRDIDRDVIAFSRLGKGSALKVRVPGHVIEFRRTNDQWQAVGIFKYLVN